MTATRIIAIRHGGTAWNVDTRLQGHLDVALNAHGQWQAQRAGQALADEDIAAIYSSDLSRAPGAPGRGLLAGGPHGERHPLHGVAGPGPAPFGTVSALT